MKTDVLDRPTLTKLLEPCEEPVVSILLPTHRTGKETRQDPIRYGNLLKSASEQLRQQTDEATASQILAPAIQIPSEVANEFWRNGSDGMALFLKRGEAFCFKLPIDMPEISLVADCFFTTPLVSYLQGDNTFLVLAASQNRVTLYSGSKHSLEEIQLDSLPDDMRSALNIDEYQSSLQYHTQTPGRGAEQALFHGHGGGEGEDRKQTILSYFQFLNRALTPYLNREKVPLVFAGVDYLFPVFQQACDYSNLMGKSVTGSPEAMSADQLHADAWYIVEPVLSAERDEKVDSFGTHAAAGRATDDFGQIVTSARDGRIESLFLDDNLANDPTAAERILGDAGRSDFENRKLLSTVARTVADTIRADGNVFVLATSQLPTERPMSAVLRY